LKYPEQQLQKQCYQWFLLQYPKQYGLLFMNLNNPRSKINGAIMKACGLVAGVADMTYLKDGKAYFFELKTDKGRQSENQRNWQQLVEAAGFSYQIIRSLNEFQIAVRKINKTY
jgi:hypothetical protein